MFVPVNEYIGINGFALSGKVLIFLTTIKTIASVTFTKFDMLAKLKEGIYVGY
jgi:hypothetical protein